LPFRLASREKSREIGHEFRTRAVRAMRTIMRPTIGKHSGCTGVIRGCVA
jgi:hypothetical protein